MRPAPSQELSQEDRDYEEEAGAIRSMHGAALQAKEAEAVRTKGEAAILRRRFDNSRADMQRLCAQSLRCPCRMRWAASLAACGQLWLSLPHALGSWPPPRLRSPRCPPSPTPLPAPAAARQDALEEKGRELRSLSSQLSDSDKLVGLLRKELREKDEMLADKEKRMGAIKAKNKELDKYKYVLDYKLRELKKELEPRCE